MIKSVLSFLLAIIILAAIARVEAPSLLWLSVIRVIGGVDVIMMLIVSYMSIENYEIRFND